MLHRISVTFVNKDGTEQTISVPVGMSILEAAHENDIELEGYWFIIATVLCFQFLTSFADKNSYKKQIMFTQ